MTGIIEMKIFAEFVGTDGVLARREVFVVRRNVDQPHLKDFGLTLEEGKAILQRVQAEQTQFQVEQCGMRDRECTGCERRRAIHDYRKRSIHTLFGVCQVRAPRLRPCSCLAPHDTAPASRLMALMAGRTTPELERVQAELGARLSFREASRVLDLFVPAARPHNHKSVRNRLARVADQIETKDLSSPHRMSRVGPGPMSVFIDGAYIRAVPGFQTRHFEIIMGRVDTDGRVARHFVSAPNISTSKVDTIRAALRAQGWIPGRDITVFSDGDPALRGAVVSAARQQVTHILDWFHMSMRVRHIEQAFEGIRQFEPELKSWLLTSAYCDVPRLRHLLWSGYVDETRDALRLMSYWVRSAVSEHTHEINAKMKRFLVLIDELATYLRLNQASVINYCQRYWKGLPISSSRAESAVNALVNARMNKLRQMRWSPRGAQRVLQARAAVFDGRLKAGAFHLAA